MAPRFICNLSSGLAYLLPYNNKAQVTATNHEKTQLTMHDKFILNGLTKCTELSLSNKTKQTKKYTHIYRKKDECLEKRRNVRTLATMKATTLQVEDKWLYSQYSDSD